MNLNIRYPSISLGDADSQLKDIRSYLYQLTDTLNACDTSALSVMNELSSAVNASGSIAASESETERRMQEYSTLRSLIIKTADYAVKNSESIGLNLSGKYVAVSDFGKYFENATVDIEGTPYGITQLYNYTAGVDTRVDGVDSHLSGVEAENVDYRVLQESYIKSGLLYYDNLSQPVYGVGVGTIYGEFSVFGRTTDTVINHAKTYFIKDGDEYIPVEAPSQDELDTYYERVLSRQQNQLYSTFSSDELAFWSGTNKLAYMRSDAVYFPSAHITGGSLAIGGTAANPAFSVSGEGYLRSVSGKIANWNISDSALYTDGAAWSGNTGMYFGTSGLRLGANFKVGSDGKITAANADISGKVTASSGQIANWNISQNALSTLNAVYGSSGMYFGTSGLSISDTFKVDTSGKLTASGADISGEITATTGKIAGWSISGNRLQNTTGTIYLDGSNGAISGASISGGTLSGTEITGGSISIGSGQNPPFKVTSSGALTASNADITGDITATSGKIAGWSISGNRLQNSTGTIYLDGSNGAISGASVSGGSISGTNISGTSISGGTISGTSISGGTVSGTAITGGSISIGSGQNPPFTVSSAGALKATNADITGDITATSGQIANWVVNQNYLATTGATWVGTTGMYFGTDGLRLGNTFKVTSAGALTATNADITGKVTASQGQIANWVINSNYLATTNATWAGTTGMYIGTSGIRLGSNFKVTNAGALTASSVDLTGDITATSGKIAGWTINGNRLQNTAGTVYLDGSNGSIYGASVSAATIAGGSITGAEIISGSLTSAEISGGTIAGTEIFGSNIYATRGDLTRYAQMTQDGLEIFVPIAGNADRKVFLYGGHTITENNTESPAPALVLGSDESAYVMKYADNSGHRMWIGNNTMTTGISINFSKSKVQKVINGVYTDL